MSCTPQQNLPEPPGRGAEGRRRASACAALIGVASGRRITARGLRSWLLILSSVVPLTLAVRGSEPAASSGPPPKPESVIAAAAAHATNPVPVAAPAAVHGESPATPAAHGEPPPRPAGHRAVESAGVAGGRPGVLSETNMLFASTNLIRSDGEQRRLAAREAEVAGFRQMLETARRLRAAKLFDEAMPNFVAVLKGNAPEELKRPAMLELALIAQEQNNLSRALEILTQYLTTWPQDPSAPEILLRQGLIYRQLGIHQMALSKFYATMTSALVVKDELFDYYRRLVLQAQAEIAETLAVQGQHAEAAAAFARLLKEDSPTLNRSRVHYRYITSLAAQGKHAETVGQAQQFLARFPEATESAEVRFQLAMSLKRLNRTSEALREIQRLLQSQQSQAREHPEALAYWQQRTGNEIANQLYQEGDFVHALDIYQSLLPLNPTPDWQLPLRYQIALAFERLEQPTKAIEFYGSIVGFEKDLGTNAPSSLRTTVDLARWRQGFLQWQDRTETARRGFGSIVAPTNAISGSTTNTL